MDVVHSLHSSRVVYSGASVHGGVTPLRSDTSHREPAIIIRSPETIMDKAVVRCADLTSYQVFLIIDISGTVMQ